MLILSRRVNEKIVIGDDIVVSVVEVRGDRVKLGFVAPGYVPIQRGELHDAESWFPALGEAECA